MRRKTVKLFIALICVLALTVVGCATKAENTDKPESADTQNISQTGDNASDNTAQSAQQGDNTDSSDEKEPDKQEAAPIETAAEAVFNMHVGWNLGNTLDATGNWIKESEPKYYETCWGNPQASAELMHHVKELGFGAVRVPITWNHHFDKDGNIDNAWMERVAEVVGYVLDEDMYCIINIHHDTGTDGWLRASTKGFEESSALFAKLWQQIAERFKDYSGKLLFESFNEMLDEKNEWSNPNIDSITAINQYNQLFVDTVRATGGKNTERNLVLNTYAAACSTFICGTFKLPVDSTENHLAVEYHMYSPYEFALAEPTEASSKTVYDENVETEINNHILPAVTSFVLPKIPVIIGECGTLDKGNTAERVKWTEYAVTKAGMYGITCFLWDNGSGFNMGVIDRKGTNDPYPEIIEAMINAANTRKK